MRYQVVIRLKNGRENNPNAYNRFLEKFGTGLKKQSEEVGKEYDADRYVFCLKSTKQEAEKTGKKAIDTGLVENFSIDSLE